MQNYITSRRWLYWHLQQRGVRVILWVLNDTDEFDAAFDECGVDGVMTDKPSLLAEYLRRRGEQNVAAAVPATPEGGAASAKA